MGWLMRWRRRSRARGFDAGFKELLAKYHPNLRVEDFDGLVMRKLKSRTDMLGERYGIWIYDSEQERAERERLRLLNVEWERKQ